MKPLTIESRSSPPRRRRRTTQRGLTLIETIVTMALLTVGFLGIAGGIEATQRLSAVDQAQSQLELSMRQLADWARDSSSSTCTVSACPSLPYHECEASPYADYTTAISHAVISGSLASGMSIQKVYVSTSATRAAASGGTDNTTPKMTCSGTCPGSKCVGDWGVQEIVLVVTDGSRSLTRTIWKSETW